eukprot:3338294-Lingulodinium_polyedra.AAC.1
MFFFSLISTPSAFQPASTTRAHAAPTGAGARTPATSSKHHASSSIAPLTGGRAGTTTESNNLQTAGNAAAARL